MRQAQPRFGWLLFLLTVLVLAAWWIPHWFAPKPEPEPLPIVTAVLPQRANVPVSTETMGMVSALPNQDVRLSPTISGRIQSILVHQGQWVQPGQALVVLDSRMLAAQSAQAGAAEASAKNELLKAMRGSRPEEIAQASSNVNLNKANLDAAQAALNREQTLFASRIAARKDVEEAQAQYQTALSQYRSAQAQLRLARQGPRREDKAIAATQFRQAQAAYRQSQIQLSNSRILSPIAGRVDQILMAVGDVADTTTPVVRVINLSPVQIKAAVQAEQLTSIHSGQTVIVHAPDEHTLLTGTIHSVGGAFDATINGFPVYLSAGNPLEALKAGMLVQCVIQTGSHPNALLIPKTALIPDPEAHNHFFVYVVNPHNKLLKRSVTTGQDVQNQVEITSGLDGQEPVVIQGGYGLAEGSTVQVRQSP